MDDSSTLKPYQRITVRVTSIGVQKIEDKKLFYSITTYLYRMFSKTCEYAIRAMIFIAQKSEHGIKVGIKEISKGIASPEHFIAKILQDLSRKGLVQSAKGPNGGFFLDTSSKKNSLADIVIAIDGDKIFSGCALGLKNCSEKSPCPLHDAFKGIRKQMFDMLKLATVADFNEELVKGLRHLKVK